MLDDTLNFTLQGAPLRAHLLHSEVCAILAGAGLAVPAIPAGCNTVQQHVTLPSGEHALVCVQRGFARTAGDDEREVNGALMIVLADPAWSANDAKKILTAALAEITK